MEIYRFMNKISIIVLIICLFTGCKDDYTYKFPTLNVEGELALDVPIEGGVYYVTATATDVITVKASRVWCKTEYDPAQSDKITITVDPNAGFKRTCDVNIVVYSLPTVKVTINQDGEDPDIETPAGPKIMGNWQFNNPGNPAKATVGKDLGMYKDGVESTEGFTAVAGPNGGNAVRVALGSYFLAEHGIEANGESAEGAPGELVNEYTVMFDYKLPESGKWYSFLQTNPANSDDAEIFIRPEGTLANGNLGYSTEPVPQDGGWHRLVIVSKVPEYYKFYIDGKLFHEGQTSSLVADNRYALNLAGILLLGDNDGDDGDMDIAQVTIWDQPLDEVAIGSLGSVGSTGYLASGALAGSWKFDDPNNFSLPDIGGNLGMYKGGAESTEGFTAVAGPSATNKAVRVSLGSYFLANHGIEANGESAQGAPGELVNEYTIMYDYRLPEMGKWYCFLQTDVANSNDGEVFVRPEGTFANSNLGYSTNKVPEDGGWHRLVIVSKMPEYYKFYIDGELFHEGQASSLVADGRYALNLAGVVLFGDDDGDDGDIEVAEVAIWRKPLTHDQISALATPGTPYPQVE